MNGREGGSIWGEKQGDTDSSGKLATYRGNDKINILRKKEPGFSIKES